MGKHPPRMALALFRWYCRPDRLEELEGDLTELYELRLTGKRKPKWRVDLQFWWDTIRCFRSYSRKSNYLMDTSYALYKSYFKLAWRQMLKNKGPVAVNVLGMGLALGFCITVYMIYAYNLEFDLFHKNTENVYRIHGIKQNGDDLERHEATPWALENAVAVGVEGIEEVTSYLVETIVVKKENQYFDEWIGLASPNFLDFFEIPLKSGSKASFKNPGSVYLTEETAEKYYGDLSPIGETLTIYIRENTKMTVTVAGVFKKIPLNSSFHFPLFLNRNTYQAAIRVDVNDWTSKRTAGHYIRVNQQQEPKQIETGINNFIELQNRGHEVWKLDRFELVPFRDPVISDHLLDSQFVNARIDPKAIMVFNIMAVLILFIGCFNMANSTMALIAKRVKEIGVRKTLGSFNHQIFVQFLFEMLIVMSLSFVVALALTDILATEIFGLFGAKFLLRDISIVNISLFTAVFLMVITALTGMFPAFYAWRFQPVSILNHKQELKGVGFLHKILTVAQYSFSIAVLIAGYFFSQNSEFLENMNYGYDNKDLVTLTVEDHTEYFALKQQIDALPITRYSFGTLDHIGLRPDRSVMKKDTLAIEVASQKIGAGYLTNMKVRFDEGRDFIPGSEKDVDNSIIVNEQFARQYLDIENGLNSTLRIDGDRCTIVGIVSGIINGEVYNDYKDEPLVFRMAPESDYKRLLVKISGHDKKEAEMTLSNLWAELIDRPFQARWQSDISFGDTQEDSEIMKTLFLWLALLGCVISVIGIAALASLNVAKKTKEISIRKVLGATLSQLIVRINKPFIRVLVLAMVMGVGLGYFVADLVLSSIYKYRMDVNAFQGIPFGIFIVVLALIMTSIAIMKPASANPTVGLRSE